MAKGKSTSITVKRINNAQGVTTIPAKNVEMILVDGQLVPDTKELDGGVVQ